MVMRGAMAETPVPGIAGRARTKSEPKRIIHVEAFRIHNTADESEHHERSGQAGEFLATVMSNVLLRNFRRVPGIPPGR